MSTHTAGIARCADALHAVDMFHGVYASTAKAQAGIDLVLGALENSNDSLLCRNVAIAIRAALQNKPLTPP